MVRKKIPLRTCIGCGKVKPKKELIRIVRSPSGEIGIDPSGKASGRGVYICYSKECLSQGLKGKKLTHALNTTVGEDIIKELGSEILHLIEEGTQI